ncbi:hypothetical protein [Alkalibacterium olivapovliticus]|uniref:Uncharacterized protein n=1 Tax=Alkalibacterium olivapovliticus TaxID=99907 RepID=A0A2T0VT57_9LACT|nr:hypothetical protein [Alkalibacterium olivapovliticus]PRY74215.1 hypothetical protein CLV38_1451 [Alkalibacterium olivapovliticus]
MKKLLTLLLLFFGILVVGNTNSVYASSLDSISTIEVSNEEELILGEHKIEDLSDSMLSRLYGNDDSREFQTFSTAPTVITYGPYYRNFTGSELATWGARNLPASQHLPAAARRAVIDVYYSINPNSTYRIRYYNRVTTRVTSVNGSIVNVSVVR